jgi:GNAT superfamily N-acetyltransferase
MTLWRKMTTDDIPEVKALADIVHSGLIERVEVFAERQQLFSAGCLVLERKEEILGYAVSHPIPPEAPPGLNTLLGALPRVAPHYYIHDFVVSPALRGSGLARTGVEALLETSSRYPKTELISVYETLGFWSRFGFTPAKQDMAAKLRAYGEGAVYMERAASA